MDMWYDNQNHTITKVLSHDDDGIITLDYNDLADKDLTGVRQSQKDIKGVRKRRHRKEHDMSKNTKIDDGRSSDDEKTKIIRKNNWNLTALL